MNTIQLTGCTPEPLMGYLKALGVFRLVAEQADSRARLAWVGGAAELHTVLSRDELVEFFLDRYHPTPIAAPWNGGSGFYGGGTAPVEAILNSSTNRLNEYKSVIARIRGLVPETKPKDEEKDQLLAKCRAELPDEVIPWLDVCFSLGEEGPSFFPLLGTGGNDGRLEFTNNFMQRLADVMPFGADDAIDPQSNGWLSASLFSESLVGLERSAIGQFDPGGIGGPNGTQGRFEANSRVNPWDFVLMIEGTLLFAGSVARRLSSAGSFRSVFPFSVESVAVGYGAASASEETSDGSRSELWLPIWNEPATISDTKHLFAEGRAQLGRRQARNSVEFALAVNLLGVSRGIRSFARYGFLKRNGLAFLAAPLGRVDVTLRPIARLLEDPPLAEWLNHLRMACRDKDKTPARYQSALRQIDRSIFEFASRSEFGNDGKYLVRVMRALGRAERTLANGISFCKDKYLRPLQGLDSQWLEQNDSSIEFRLAASLAGIRATKKGEVGRSRVYLEQVSVAGFVTWHQGNASSVWTNRDLAANLGAIFRRRQVEAFRAGLAGIPVDTTSFARLDDVIKFLRGETNDEKLADLLWGLIGVDFPPTAVLPDDSNNAIPFEFGVPRLLTRENCFVQRGNYWNVSTDGEPNAKPASDIFQSLWSGRPNAVAECVDLAASRLNSGGLIVKGCRNRQRRQMPLSIATAISADRLLAALLFPLARRDLDRIANAVLFPPESEE